MFYQKSTTIDAKSFAPIAFLWITTIVLGCADSPPPIIAPVTTPPTGNSLYVDATHGADSNNGAIATPFLKISECLAVATTGQTCVLRAGVYGETVTPHNDGIAISAYPGETATISAADAVQGWTANGDGIYTAPVTFTTVPPQKEGRAQYFPGNQLFYNGTGVAEAQWPTPSSDPLHPNWATISAATSEVDSRGNPIPATVTDIKAPKLAGTDAKIHIWSGTDPYEQYSGAVQSAPGGSITYLTTESLSSNFAASGGLYYLVGTPELLSTNTWYYDTAKHILHWQPPAGVDPNTADVRFKQRDATIDLSGRSNITIQGINLVGAGVLMDANSKNNVLDTITATYLSSVQQQHSNGPSDHDDYYSFGIILDGTGNTLKNSVVAYTAMNGVTIHGTGNIVTNSLIHDVDFYGGGAAAIYVGDGAANTVNSTITTNTIYRTGHSAITVALNPDVQVGTAQTHVTGMEIANNNLFQTMFLATDGGVIYTCCRDETTGSHIHDNWIHGDVTQASVTFPANSTSLHPYAGVYYDNGAGGVQIANNFIWNSFPDLFLHGTAGADTTMPGLMHPTMNVDISNNTTPDATSLCNLKISALTAPSVNITADNNQIYFAAETTQNGSNQQPPSTNNNVPSAPGSHSVPLTGCSFTGCTIGGSPPPFPTGVSVTGAPSTCSPM